MADNINKHLDSEDNQGPSLTVRGASIAGFTVVGLGLPSVWRTLNRNFPKGLSDSLTSKFVRKDISAIELLPHLAKKLYDQTTNPETLAQIYLEDSRFLKGKRQLSEAAEINIFTIQAESQLERLTDQLEEEIIEASSESQSIDELTSRIKKAEDTYQFKSSRRNQRRIKIRKKGQREWQEGNMALRVNKSEALRDIRKAALFDYIQDEYIKTGNFNHPTIEKDLAKKILEQPGNVSDDILDRVFSSLEHSTHKKDKQFAVSYLSRLQGRRKHSVLMHGGEYDYIAVVNNLDHLQTTQIPTLKPSVKSRLRSQEIHASEFKIKSSVVKDAQGSNIIAKYASKMDIIDSGKKTKAIQQLIDDSKVLDDFMKNLISATPWLEKGDYYKNTHGSLRNLLRDVTDAINEHNISNDLEDAMNFTMSLEHPESDIKRKYYQVSINLKKPGSKAFKIRIPLPNKDAAILPHSGVEILSTTTYRNYIDDPIQKTGSADYAMRQGKTFMKRFIKEYDRHDSGKWHSLKNLQDLFLSGYLSRDVSTHPLRNLHIMSRIHTENSRQLYESGRVTGSANLRRRATGLQDWKLYNMYKKTGRDFVIYDQEYYMLGKRSGGMHGIQVTRKNPNKAFPWQVSWRRMSSSGEFLESGNIFIKTQQLEEAIRIGPGNQHYEAFMDVAKNMGFDRDRSKEYLRKIEREGVSMESAMRTLNRKWDGAVMVDQAGKTGPDRVLLNYYSKKSIGQLLIPDNSAIDLLEMTKVLSSHQYGHSLEMILQRTLESADAADVNKIANDILNNTSSYTVGSKFREELKIRISQGMDKTDAIVQAFKSAAHDARDDVMASSMAFDLMIKRDPLMGRSGTLYGEMDKFIRSGYMDARQTIQSLNNFMLGKHFVGEEQAANNMNYGKWGMMLTDISTNALKRGQLNQLPGHHFDPFILHNTLQKRTDQIFHISPMYGENLEGRIKYPFMLNLEKLVGTPTEQVGKLYERNSQAATRTIFSTMKGVGLTPDSAALFDEKTVRPMFTKTDPQRISIKIDSLKSSKDLKFLGPLGDILNTAKEYQKRHSHIPETKDLNYCIKQVLNKKNKNIAQLEDRLQTLSGHKYEKAKKILHSKYQNISNQALILNSMGETVYKYEDWHPTRITDMGFVFKGKGKNKKLFEVIVEAEKLVALEGKRPSAKINVGWVPNAVTGQMAALDELLVDYDPREITEKQFMRSSHKRPIDIVLEMNAIGRQEFGTVQRTQFLRILKTMQAKKMPRQKIENFIKSVFSHQTVSFDPDGSARINMTDSSVKAKLADLNNFSADKMYSHMKDAGLIWDQHNLKAWAEYNNIAWSYDQEVMKRRFQDLADREIASWNDRQSKLLAKEAAYRGGTVEQQIDIEKTKYLRARVDPYFDVGLGKQVKDIYKTPTARFWDVKYYKGQWGDTRPIFGMLYDDIVGARMEHELQGTLVNNVEVRTPGFLIRRREKMWKEIESPFLHKLSSSSKGARGRKARRNLERLVESFTSRKISEGSYIINTDLSEVIDGINRTKDLLKMEKEDLNPEFYKKSTYQSLETKVSQVKEEIRMREKVLKSNINPKKRESINNELSSLKRQITHASEKLKEMEKFGKNTAENNLSKNIGTIWEQIDRNHTTGNYYDWQRIDFGRDAKNRKIKVAPQDLILIRTKGYSPLTNDEFWEKVIDKADEITDSLSRRNPKEREHLKQTTRLIRSKFKGRPKDYLMLPSIQTIRDVFNIDYIHIGDREKLMRGREAKMLEDLLTTVNEYQKKKSTKLRNLVEDKYSGFFANLLSKASGKNLMGLGDLYVSEGQRGMALSPTLFKEKAISNFKTFYGHNVITESMDPNKLKAMRMLERIKEPFNSFVYKQDFLNMKIEGMNVKDFFMKKVEGSNEAKRKIWGKILAGESPLLDYWMRDPQEVGIWGRGLGLTWVLDPDVQLLKGQQTHGFVPSPVIQKMINADFDSDYITRSLLEIKSVDEYNQAHKAIVERNKKFGKYMVEFWEEWGKVGNFDTARENLMRRGTRPEIFNKAIDVVESLATDTNKKITVNINEDLQNKGMFGGFTIEDITTAEANKRGLKTILDENMSYLNKSIYGLTEEELIKNAETAYKNLQAGTHAVGEITSFSRSLEVRMERIKKLTFDYKDTHGSFQKVTEALKYFPGSVSGDLKETYRELEKNVFKSTHAFEELQKRLVGKTSVLSQVAISNKKMLGESADEMLLDLMQSLQDIQNPRSQKLLETGYGFSKFETKSLAMFEILEKLASTQESYREMARMESANITSKGLDINTMVMNANHNNLQKLIQPLRSEEKTAVINEYWNIFRDDLNSAVSKSSSAWRDSIKQTLLGKSHTLKSKMRQETLGPKFGKGFIEGLKKFTYEHDLGKLGLYTFGGLGLLQFFTPNQMTGGIGDFGIDLGARPGKGGETGDFLSFGGVDKVEDLEKEARLGEDPFSKKWAYVVENNPSLQDKNFDNAFKDYKAFVQNDNTYQPYYGQKPIEKRKYVDNRQQFSKYYKTNSMRKIEAFK